MTEHNLPTVNVAQFAQLLVTLQPLLQKVERKGAEMPPLDELLRFADAQKDSGTCQDSVLTTPSTAHTPPVGKSISVSNKATTKTPLISTTGPSSGFIGDKCPVRAVAVDQQSKLTPVPAQDRLRVIEDALSPTYSVQSAQGTQVPGIRSPATPTRSVQSAQGRHLISPGVRSPATPTPVHHFGTLLSWEEDPELAPFLSLKSLEEIALGHKINGFTCVNCNHYNRVKESEDEEL